MGRRHRLAARRRATVSDPPGGTDFFDGPRLDGLHGTSLLLLGETHSAGSVLAAAIDNRADTEVKGKALLTLDLARCRLLQYEHDEAARLTHQSLDLASGSIVEPIVAKATEVAGALQSAAGVAIARPVFEHLAAIEASTLGGLA